MKGKPWTAQLVDLHCAAMVEDANDEQGSLTGLAGTPEYAAPEVAIWYWHEQASVSRSPASPVNKGAVCKESPRPDVRLSRLRAKRSRVLVEKCSSLRFQLASDPLTHPFLDPLPLP
jgi:hypothetical protein